MDESNTDDQWFTVIPQSRSGIQARNPEEAAAKCMFSHARTSLP